MCDIFFIPITPSDFPGTMKHVGFLRWRFFYEIFFLWV